MNSANPTEHITEKPSFASGFFALLRAFLHGRGSGALAVAAVAAGMLVPASGAVAAETGPPTFLHNSLGMEVFSTRAYVRAQLTSGGLSGEAKSEYITAKALEEAEARKEEAKWIVVGTEQLESNVAGEGLNYVYLALSRLSPDTAYYERFVASNADGEATEKAPFKTRAVAEPEVAITPIFGHSGANAGDLEFGGGAEGPTMAAFAANIETNGAETEYAFEYSLPEAGHAPAPNSKSWQEFTSGATGTITVAEEAREVSASVTGLKTETTYYVRLKAHNELGTLLQTEYPVGGGVKDSTFTTPAPPITKPVTKVEGGSEIRNVTTSSAHVVGFVRPHGLETTWRFEYRGSLLEPWTPVVGAGGTISGAEAAAAGYHGEFHFGAGLVGLSPSTKYYVRLFAENAEGEAEVCSNINTEGGCEPISSSTEIGLAVFETLGPPSVTTFAVHSLQGESLQLLGGVDAKSTPTSAEQTITVEGAPTGGTFTLTFDGRTTKELAYNAPANEAQGSGSVEEALLRELDLKVAVEGPDGGPYTVFFDGSEGGVSEPPIEANGSGLTPSGTVKVATLYKGGETTEVHYRFAYLSQKQFEASGWSGAQETSEQLAPSGGELEVVSAVLPALTGGETYRYRILATSGAGGGVIEGSERSLTAPTPPPVEASPGCPNEAFRTGLSAHLPDCRAYEMVSPVDKEGAQEPWQYLTGLGSDGLVGEDGEHFALEAPVVRWGAGPGAGGSPYFFTREGGKGWAMQAGSPQPETGLDTLYPEMYSADLGEVAFYSEYNTSLSTKSADREFKVGPAGGPYATVASVPIVDETAGLQGWAAANGSFSKLVFETRDHELPGQPTGTKSGADLYEYTSAGGLRQLNVSGEPAATIGVCGAVVARGREEENLESPRNVSADGSRVFFYAGSGSGCPTAGEFTSVSNGFGSGTQPRIDLYMRVDGEETVDIGAYRFLGANAEGTRLLLENSTGEVLGYSVETKAMETRSSEELASAQELELLDIPELTEAGEGAQAFSHPRYTYWSANDHRELRGEASAAVRFAEQVAHNSTPQVYRYDSVERVVQCISCASPSDPDPKQSAYLGSDEDQLYNGGPVLGRTDTSANGEFAFFTTPAALVPQDVDGELDVSNVGNNEYLSIGAATSPSSDVYEWRAVGVDGCAHAQGCLALITDGRGGFMNLLLGSADEGRDVFIYTRSKLLGQDTDTSGDIYDARIGGGLPGPPARPAECEGDACSTPPPAPNDATPSSLTFSGNGNIVQPAPTGPAVKSKPKPKKKKPKHRKARKRVGSTVKRSGSRRGRAARGVVGGK